MLTEFGSVKIEANGIEWTFEPSFANIARIGTPQEIVSAYADLHGPDSERIAVWVIACCAPDDDITDLLGWHDESGWHQGAMPVNEQIVIARHLMRHGIIGTAKPSNGDGKYSDSFNAGEYVCAAMVHIGMSRKEAESLSMTEFQALMAAKFPDQNKQRDVPSRDEYREFMAKVKNG